MKYEIRENKFGKFFIKNNKYHYLDSYEVWGLDTSLWYDTIDYKFFKVKFIEEGNKKYIQLSKNKNTRQLEHTFN